MKPFKAIFASSLIVTSAGALLVLPFQSKPTPARFLNDRQEAIMNPGIQLPTKEGQEGPSSGGPPNGDVILSDVIGAQRSINVFASFTRDISSVSSRLDSAGLNTTVLAPTNSALSALPRKPWEDPEDYAKLGAEAYSGKDGEDRAHRNLRRFAEAHIVFASPWKEGEKAERMGGGELWWESKDGKTLIQPGNVEVERVATKVANGEVWVLKDVLNYAS
ncbi:hypothetical protein MBLNU13_g00688t1 [Cladosporium sp. NU13]